MGLRAQESNKRAKRDRINWIPRYRQWHYKPIFYWETWEIWQYIRDNHLPYCHLYDEGFHRLGCVICPLHSKRIRALHEKRWPGHYKVYEKVKERLDGRET